MPKKAKKAPRVYTITVRLKVTPSEYHRARNSAKGACELALEMLMGRADLPEEIDWIEAVDKVTGESYLKEK